LQIEKLRSELEELKKGKGQDEEEDGKVSAH
jgi:hypothetical protein